MLFVVALPFAVAVSMVMLAAAEQPRAGDVHGKAEAGDRDRLGEADRHRRENARDRLVADQERDHREDDGAGEPGKVAKFAGAERKTPIVGMPAGIAVGECREQQRPRMRAHMQPVRHQRDRPEQPAADNLGDHHRAAERNHRPCLALALFVSDAEKAVPMQERRCGAFAAAHVGAHFR
jgi:hypothetical protein